MTVSGLVWATKLTPTHAEATYLGCCGSWFAPFQTESQMLFVVAARGCKGLLGKTACRMTALDVAGV